MKQFYICPPPSFKTLGCISPRTVCREKDIDSFRRSCEHGTICVGVRKGRALTHTHKPGYSKIFDMLRACAAAPGQNERLCAVPMSGPPHSLCCVPHSLQKPLARCPVTVSTLTICSVTEPQSLSGLSSVLQGETRPWVPGIKRTVKARYSLFSLINVKTNTKWTSTCQGH